MELSPAAARTKLGVARGRHRPRGWQGRAMGFVRRRMAPGATLLAVVPMASGCGLAPTRAELERVIEITSSGFWRFQLPCILAFLAIVAALLIWRLSVSVWRRPRVFISYYSQNADIAALLEAAREQRSSRLWHRRTGVERWCELGRRGARRGNRDDDVLAGRETVVEQPVRGVEHGHRHAVAPGDGVERVAVAHDVHLGRRWIIGRLALGAPAERLAVRAGSGRGRAIGAVRGSGRCGRKGIEPRFRRRLVGGGALIAADVEARIRSARGEQGAGDQRRQSPVGAHGSRSDPGVN